jgi:hypothetical protein
MAFTTPGTALPSAVLTSAFWNTNVRDNTDAIRAAQINVKSTTKVDTFTTTSATPVDITGASVTITPSSATSLVLVMFSTVVSGSEGDTKAFILLRGATNIGGGTAAGSRLSAIAAAPVNAANTRQPVAATFLDNPATTSAVTYKVQTWSDIAGRTTVIGSSFADTNTAAPNHVRTPFTITAIEVPV